MTLQERISEISKEQRELRAQQQDLCKVIIAFMKNQELDEVEANGQCISLRSVKRASAVSRKLVMEHLVTVLGDQQRAEAVCCDIYERRQQSTKEILTISKVK